MEDKKDRQEPAEGQKSQLGEQSQQGGETGGETGEQTVPAKKPGERRKKKREQEPYLPTAAAEEMDWESSLQGVKPLFEPLSPNRKDREKPVEKQAKKASESGDSSSETDSNSNSNSDSSSDEENSDSSDNEEMRKAKEEAEKLQAKVSTFLDKKKKADAVAEITRRLGQDIVVYNAIQAGCSRSTAASNLMGGKKSTIPLPTGIVDSGDGRVLSGGLKINMADHKVISTSFDSDWRCLACAHTHTRPALTRPGADTNSSPLAFMLGDQSSR
jgi:nucleotide-binding universal stress UspA family protein